MIVKTTKIFSILVFMALVIWAGGYLAFLNKVGHLKPELRKVETDAIVVLTGGVDRINTGLDLLDDGYAENLFISGVDTRVSIRDIIAMWKEGDDVIAPCCIILGHNAYNTKGNAIEARDWINAEKLTSIRLVTAYYHMPRAAMEFEHALPDIQIIQHPVISRKMANIWVITFSEYHKTMFTWLGLQLGL